MSITHRLKHLKKRLIEIKGRQEDTQTTTQMNIMNQIEDLTRRREEIECEKKSSASRAQKPKLPKKSRVNRAQTPQTKAKIAITQEIHYLTDRFRQMKIQEEPYKNQVFRRKKPTIPKDKIILG